MNIVELIKTAAENFEDITFDDSYSGRGMYGDVCIGISGDHLALSNVLCEVSKQILSETFDVAMDGTESEAYAARDEATSALDSLFNYRTDSMGRGMIYYWPSLTVDSKCGGG